jgi:ATP-dependent DNA ligase
MRNAVEPAEIKLAREWIVPFFPMRPAHGARLSRSVALDILEKQEDHQYLYQPKLNGDRCILAIASGRVIVCNRRYGWYRYQIKNAAAFLKLGNETIFDGEVFQGEFFPFDCLALEGRSYQANTADERAVMAYQMCRFMGVQWMFPKPTKKWLLGLRKNLPVYEGVVRKRANQGYIVLPNATSTSTGWIKHLWA